MTTDPDDVLPNMRPEDDAKRATNLRNEVLSAIKQFENRLLSAAFDFSDEEDDVEDHQLGGVDFVPAERRQARPVPEFLEEEKEKLRNGLYDSLRHLFLNEKTAEGQLSIGFFEEAVYARVSERIRRTLGYYQALRRAQEEILRNNQELGDPHALEMPMRDMSKLLSSLDEVDFVRQLGTSLGIFQDDLDKIVENVIIREFALRRRTEHQDE